jgi:hypothetical protein
MSEDIEKIYEDLYEKGYTDGLPIIPPTKERIKRMLEFTDKKPDDALGTVPPSENEVTVETAAVHAVMAGCKPEYFPVFVAAMQAELDRPNLRESVQPGRSNPLIIINGPIAKEIGMSTGWGIGPTTLETTPIKRPNVTIGRAMVLCLYNVGHIENKLTDRRFEIGTCIAEDEEHSPWEPLHVERGFKRETSTVTVKNGAPRSLVGITIQRSSGIFSIDIRNWAKTFVPIVPYSISNAPGYSTGVLIIPPVRAKWFADNGMGKDEIRKFLYEMCRYTPQKEWYAEYPPEMREDILQTAFAPSPAWVRSMDPIPVFGNCGKDLWIVVAGQQPDRGFCVAAGGVGGHGFDPVNTKPIEFADGTPVKSVNDFKRKKK